MDETLTLVNHWSAFKARFPQGTLEDFCQYHLTTQRMDGNAVSNFRGLVPPDRGAFLIKLLGRIVQCYGVYATAALRKVPGIRQVEDFYFLNSITQLGQVKKTEVINLLLFELSSGGDIINRIRDIGLIQETVDEHDKRVRLLSGTGKGKAVLLQCYQQLSVVNDMIWRGLPADDQRLCIALLKDVETTHSAWAMELKGADFDVMVSKVLGVHKHTAAG